MLSLDVALPGMKRQEHDLNQRNCHVRFSPVGHNCKETYTSGESSISKSLEVSLKILFPFHTTSSFQTNKKLILTALLMLDSSLEDKVKVSAMGSFSGVLTRSTLRPVLRRTSLFCMAIILQLWGQKISINMISPIDNVLFTFFLVYEFSPNNFIMLHYLPQLDPRVS